MQGKIRFHKMQGIGNDFVIIDGLRQSISLQALQSSLPQLADRHFGIGFDQLILIEPSTQADFFCRIFNADGSEAEQCGNGLRCAARFLYENGFILRRSFSLETKAGIFPVEFQDDGDIKMTMGTPKLVKQVLELTSVSEKPLIVSILSMGNPHAIMKVVSASNELARELGPKISSHADFPEGINVGFMEIIKSHHIRLRTFERGSGLTHACGSNACAAVAAGIINGSLSPQVKVEYSHGFLLVEWLGDNHTMTLTGPATWVFAGEISLG